MRALFLRLRWIALGTILAATIATLWAQEAQISQRGFTAVRGNIIASTGTVYSGGGVVRDYRTNTSITTDAATTYTAAQVLTGLITRSVAGAAVTDVLPTAANLIAAIPGAVTGMAFWVVVQSPSGNIILNGASTGVTYAGQCGLTLGSEDSQLVLITITSSGAYRANCIKSDA